MQMVLRYAIARPEQLTEAIQALNKKKTHNRVWRGSYWP